jgi:hypothetical protein
VTEPPLCDLVSSFDSSGGTGSIEVSNEMTIADPQEESVSLATWSSPRAAIISLYGMGMFAALAALSVSGGVVIAM